MLNLPRTRGIGIPWYRRDNYRRVLEVMIDRDILPRTFDKWLGLAEKAERRLQKEGHIVLRASLDADEFVKWCRAKGRDPDASARAAWGSEYAMERLGGAN